MLNLFENLARQERQVLREEMDPMRCQRRDVLIEKAAAGVAAAFAAAGESAPGAGERVATHPASASPAANGGKAAK